MVNLYLAHPVDSRKYIREWQTELEKKTSITFINPFDIEGVKPTDKRIDLYKNVDSKLIVERDVNEIKKSDGVIAIIDGNKSIGTIMEIVYARANGKNTYVYAHRELSEHPWVKYHSTELFKTKFDLERFLCRIFPL